MSLPDTVAKFVADTKPFDGPVDASARKVSQWGRTTERASLQARKALLSASDAADRAAASQKAAADAADKLAKGELDEAEAAKAATRAAKDLERASIAQREAQLAAKDAADRAARQYRQEARDAELAATAQILATLKAKGSVGQYNEVLRQAQVLHGDLSKTALGAFKTIETEGNAAYEALNSAGQSLAETNKLWVVGIVNGLTLLPTLSAVAADGISLGLGGAIAAVGLKFAAQNRQVRAEYSSLGHDIFSGLSKDATPFVRTLDDIAKQGRASFAGWEPEIRSIWAEMAPEVDKFATSAIRSLDEFKPALESITRGFDAELNTLAPQLAGDMHNVATGVQAIGDAAAKNPQALAEMVHDLSLLTRGVGDAIGFFVRFHDVIQNTLDLVGAGGPAELLQMIGWVDKLGHSVGLTGHGFDVAGGSFQSFAQQAAGADAGTVALSQDMDKLASNTASATDKANALSDAFTRLLDPEKAVFDDSAKLRDRIAELAKELKLSHGALNDNSAAARTAKESFTKMLTSAEQLSTDMLNAHHSIGEVRAALTPYIDSMYKAAGSNKEARALVDAFVKSLGMVPPKKGTTLKSNADDQRRRVEFLQRAINALHGKTIDIYQTMHLTTVQAYVNQREAISGYHPKARGGPLDAGPIAHFADGGFSGYVRGPGTTTSDSILAALSDKEYVVNAEATQKYRPLLDAINFGLDGFAAGGALDGTLHTVLGKGAGASLSKSVRRSSGRELAHLAALDRAAARLARGRARPEYLSALAAQESLARMRNTVYGGWFSGGPSFVGSAHGSVVQHTTNVYLTVQGSVVQERGLVEAVRQGLAQRSVLNAGNNGATIPRTV